MLKMWIAAAGVGTLVGCTADDARALISVSEEAAGENCANGGTRIDVGVDKDDSDSLDAAEVDSTSFVCNGESGTNGVNGENGANGEDGVDGQEALVEIEAVDPGAECPFGGFRVETGLDDNGDGVLDDNEVTDRQLVCENNTVRIATFNTSLNRSSAGELIKNLTGTMDPQAQQVAEIIQTVRPDVLLINEFDYDATQPMMAADLFRTNYLEMSQNGRDPITYPYAYVAPSNTGVDSGVDFDGDGNLGGLNDAFGFGFFEGQFAMVVFSRYEIDVAAVRTFQTFRWQDMPGALLPDDPSTPEPNDYYSTEALDVFRLSSKSHWDVPIQLGDRTVHFLTSHPTPPVFDGPEDRNGTRNHDEIRFWVDYVDSTASSYIYDDVGVMGGLASGEAFVVAGDLNSDPADGDSVPGAANQLLDSPFVNGDNPPSSLGGPEQALVQGDINDVHISDPAFDTADFGDSAPGNLRVDYVVPSADLVVVDQGVFWPPSTDPTFPLVASSDHRLVYIDVLP
ncbi:MAG: endonuclease/exonuclease/phosphatase family protein [Myxococcota bacterium]